MYRNALLSLIYEVALKRNHPTGTYKGYRKVLVPLDGTEEAEMVLGIVPEILAPGDEGILLRVILPCKEEHVAQVIASAYLSRVLTGLSGVSSGWRHVQRRSQVEIRVLRSIDLASIGVQPQTTMEGT
ncbi:MAG: hypothetical protein ACE5Q6_23635 [Dehalococcoidia bacterium]